MPVVPPCPVFFLRESEKLEEKVVSKRTDFMPCFLLWILLLALSPGIRDALQTTQAAALRFLFILHFTGSRLSNLICSI